MALITKSASSAPETIFDRKWTKGLRVYLTRLKKARAYNRAPAYGNHKVIVAAWLEDDDRVSAEVQGTDSDPYMVDLTVTDRGRLTSECSCPVEVDCKHGAALALVLAWEAYRRDHPDFIPLDSLFPVGWLTGKTTPPPDLIVDVETLFAKADSLADGAGAKIIPIVRTRPERPEPPPWWRQYLAERDAKARVAILKQAVENQARGSSWATEFIVKRLLEFDNPVLILRHFDSVIEGQKKYHFLHNARSPDPALQEFLNSDELREIEADHERRIAEERLLGWLSKPTEGDRFATTRTHGRLGVQWLTHLMPGGLEGIHFRVLVQKLKGGMTARKASGLVQLSNEVQYKRREFDPLHQRFLLWVAGRPEVQDNRYSYYEKDADETALPVRDLFAWIAAWGESGLLRWDDGTPVQFIPSRAVLTLAPYDDGKARWVLRAASYDDLPAEDFDVTEARLLVETESWGRPRGANPRIFLRHGNVLRPVETHGMPLEVLAAARLLPELPLAKIANTTAGARLARRLSLAGTERNPFLEEVSVHPVVELRLEDNYLTVSAWARSEEGNRRFVRHGHGEWEPAGAEASAKEASNGASASLEAIEALPVEENGAPGTEVEPSGEAVEEPRRAAVLAQIPRPADLKPVDEWLERLVPADMIANVIEGPVPKIGWRLTSTAHIHLLEAWATRPSRIEYLGDKEFRELVEIRRTPKFAIEIESSGVDWLKVSVGVEEELETLSYGEVATVLDSADHDLVVLRGGRVFRKADLEEWRSKVESLEALGLSAEAGEQRLHALHLVGAPKGALEALDRGSEDLQRLADSARSVLASFKGIPVAPVEPVTAAFLRPYQSAGADFLVWAGHTFGGAVLADDMGLGKTLQVLAALTAMRAEWKGEQEGAVAGGEGDSRPVAAKKPRSPKGRSQKASSNSELRTQNSELDRVVPPSLVVCPASVAHNWQREAVRFTPGLKVLVLESGKERQKYLGQLSDYDLVIINYALLRRDIGLLEKQEWLAVVVDEAQAIKNPRAEVSRVVKTLRARFRIALTGTPIENRIMDIWSIVDFSLPGYLGQLDPAQGTSTDPATAARFYAMLRARLRPVLLRRLKAEVAPELPERIENRIDCVMEIKQHKIYLAELKRARLLLEETGNEVKGKHRIQMLAILTRLRQICCEPGLVGYPDAGSAKVEQLVELLTSLLESGHKVLVFSQFVRMLERLRTRLEKEKITCHMLTGQSKRRGDIVDAFEKDPSPGVFLISLKAGGTGLNLTSASQVVLFDPWWNPAVEAQAIDRSHRIGQDKTVMAYRLVTEDTIEERILELQERKRELVKNVLEEEAFNRTLTKGDFEFLLTGEREV